MRFREAVSLCRCNRTIVVVPEAAERVYSYGVDRDRVVIVSNTEDETTFKASIDKCDPDILSKYKSHR